MREEAGVRFKMKLLDRLSDNQLLTVILLAILGFPALLITFICYIIWS